MALGAAIIVGGGIAAFGAIESSKIAAEGAEDVAAQAREPQVFDQSLVEDLFTGQQQILLGANPDEVAENFIVNRVLLNAGPDAARSVSAAMGSIRSLLLAGKTTEANASLKKLNTQFQSAGIGIPVSAAISGGGLQFNFADAGVNRFIEEARLLGPSIRGQRLSGIQQFNALIGAPSFATPESFERFRGLTEQNLLSELEDREQQAREQAVQTGNVFGLNPAASLSRISERGLLSRENIESQSIDRAIGLITATQGIRGREAGILEGLLFPQSTQNLLALQQQGQASTNQLAAAQLSASTQAGLAGVGAEASGTFGAFQSGADALTLAAILRASGGPSSGITGLSGLSPFAV